MKNTLSKAADWHLRLTILPQCNERCRYCNPKGSYEKSPQLSDEEILSIVVAAVECGIHRVHWTGGEPCLRDIVKLISAAKSLGMTEQIMTTNGTIKVDEVQNMKSAGLDRVNVSLDSLDANRNAIITGKNYFPVKKKWIKTACAVFDKKTKMNIVPMVDNYTEIPSFVQFASKFSGKLMLKFIELCPNNPAFFEDDIGGYAVSRKEIIEALQQVGSLYPINGMGDNPNAEYYVVGRTGVEVILVTMPSQDYKCGLEKCRKLRISPYGLAGSCIQQNGVNISRVSHEEKVNIINGLMAIRENYSDVAPCNRNHLRLDYGIWRFGNVSHDQCGKT